jgi:tRNA-(ms[2]io[6]A)-hydroxylase
MCPLPAILLRPTGPGWWERAATDLDTLVLDVAHAEKRAASTVLSFTFRFPDLGLAEVWSRLCREELTHFEAVLRELRRRDRPFMALEPPPYTAELVKLARSGKSREAMLDALVCAALIEARSGERLAILEDHLDDGPLRALCAFLRPPEERHWEMLLELAGRFGDVEPRLAVLAAREAELVQRGFDGVRVHG